MSLMNGMDRLRLRVRRPVACTPGLFDAFMRLRGEPMLVSSDSDIVIDGFPRSGNSYSVAAFRHVNPACHIGEHLHAAAHVMRACRLKVPAVVLIRAPRPAALSYVVFRPTLRVEDALAEYVSFYGRLWDARAGFIVADFESAISNFGDVTRRVNEKFQTSFREYEPTEENEAEVRASVEQMSAARTHGQVIESRVGRPSEAREIEKRARELELKAPRTARLLERADRWYEAFLRDEL